MNILPVSKRVLEQFKVFKTATAPGKWIRAIIRFDDKCRNGHNTFSITGETWDGSGGCIHDEIARAFPHLAPFIKWHGVSTDGPTHYVANTVYHAGERIGEGKKRDFAAARSCAVWPDATDEQLSAEPAELKKMLLARLPALMADFKADIEKLGFEY